MSAATVHDVAAVERRRRRIPLSMWLTIALHLAAMVYAYGRLVERVDSLQYDVRELRALILQVNSGGKK